MPTNKLRGKGSLRRRVEYERYGVMDKICGYFMSEIATVEDHAAFPLDHVISSSYSVRCFRSVSAISWPCPNQIQSRSLSSGLDHLPWGCRSI